MANYGIRPPEQGDHFALFAVGRPPRQERVEEPVEEPVAANDE